MNLKSKYILLLKESKDLLSEIKNIYENNKDRFSDDWLEFTDLCAINNEQFYKDWYNKNYKLIENLNEDMLDVEVLNKLVNIRFKMISRYKEHLSVDNLGTILNVNTNLIGDLVTEIKRHTVI